jgi:hypothetical protein
VVGDSVLGHARLVSHRGWEVTAATFSSAIDGRANSYTRAIPLTRPLQAHVDVRIDKQRVLGMTTVLVAIARLGRSPNARGIIE